VAGRSLSFHSVGGGGGASTTFRTESDIDFLRWGDGCSRKLGGGQKTDTRRGLKRRPCWGSRWEGKDGISAAGSCFQGWSLGSEDMGVCGRAKWDLGKRAVLRGGPRKRGSPCSDEVGGEAVGVGKWFKLLDGGNRRKMAR